MAGEALYRVWTVVRLSRGRRDAVGAHLFFSSSAAVVFTCCTLLLSLLQGTSASTAFANNDSEIPIFVYHRFGPVVADSMTVTTPVFASQLHSLSENGFTVIPLRQFVRYRLGQAPPPPPRSVAITVDDAHRSVYTDMFPLVRQYHIPVTLFVYPSAISHASYALTWEQLRELRDSGLFDIQSHSYWHPNFKTEKRRLTPRQYEQLVDMQLTKSKTTLEVNLGVHVDLLAWPFGIYDDKLMKKAADAGYVAALSLERRHVRRSDALLALPRYLMTDADRGKAFARMLTSSE
jgi:peptidoglycan/xylan/chitin deacetylase (PgdA/CDA1 family)